MRDEPPDRRTDDEDEVRDEPRDAYTSTLHLPDEGDGAEGDWIICDVCEGSWRPDAPESHEDDCLGVLLGQAREDNAYLRRKLQAFVDGDTMIADGDGGWTSLEEAHAQLHHRVQDLENVLGMIPREQLADGIRRAMQNVLGDAPVLVKERLEHTQQALEALCSELIQTAALAGRKCTDLEGDPVQLAKWLGVVAEEIVESVRKTKKALVR